MNAVVGAILRTSETNDAALIDTYILTDLSVPVYVETSKSATIAEPVRMEGRVICLPLAVHLDDGAPSDVIVDQQPWAMVYHEVWNDVDDAFNDCIGGLSYLPEFESWGYSPFFNDQSAEQTFPLDERDTIRARARAQRDGGWALDVGLRDNTLNLRTVPGEVEGEWRIALSGDSMQVGDPVWAIPGFVLAVRNSTT
jgi:hypothetical protein